MTLSLVGLIAYNGILAFWPKPIEAVSLHPSEAFQGKTNFAGKWIQRKIKPNTHPSQYEHRYFVGDRNYHGGVSFACINENSIISRTHPLDILSISRRTGSDAIGYPLKLTLENGTSLSFPSENFLSILKEAVEERKKRWKQIRQLEKKVIGHINRQIENHRLAILKLERASHLDASVIQEKQQAITTLEIRYETYAQESQRLRALQKKGVLDVILENGTSFSLPFAEIESFHAPNSLSSFQKTILFAKNFWNFLSQSPREANTKGGIFPALFGTLVMTLFMAILVTPFGILAAIYLHEYAKSVWLVRCVRIGISNLAAVPSIVYGVFGLGFFVYFIGGSIDKVFYPERLPNPTFGTGGLLWASFTLALLTLPVVVIATEEALSSIPRSLREASLACGASKWQTVRNIVLPAAAPGMLTGMILAMARGAGEVAPLMLVGVVKVAPDLPFDSVPPFLHLDRKIHAPSFPYL